jgi:transposase
MPAQSETAATGIDEIRRGKARFVTDPDTGRIRQVVDRWLTGFVDLTGAHGLLGQVEGRAGTDVCAWLAAQPQSWHDAIEVVAIDMSAPYRAAIREHLPRATIVADCFMAA